MIRPHCSSFMACAGLGRQPRESGRTRSTTARCTTSRGRRPERCSLSSSLRPPRAGFRASLSTNGTGSQYSSTSPNGTRSLVRRVPLLDRRGRELVVGGAVTVGPRSRGLATTLVLVRSSNSIMEKTILIEDHPLDGLVSLKLYIGRLPFAATIEFLWGFSHRFPSEPERVEMFRFSGLIVQFHHVRLCHVFEDRFALLDCLINRVIGSQSTLFGNEDSPD